MARRPSCTSERMRHRSADHLDRTYTSLRTTSRCIVIHTSAILAIRLVDTLSRSPLQRAGSSTTRSKAETLAAMATELELP